MDKQLVDQIVVRENQQIVGQCNFWQLIKRAQSVLEFEIMTIVNFRV